MWCPQVRYTYYYATISEPALLIVSSDNDYSMFHLILLCNSYNTGARDVWHLLHRSPRAHTRGLRAMHLASARDITILYPVGTAIIVTIDINADLSFVT